jgi:hypothetical protein
VRDVCVTSLCHCSGTFAGAIVSYVIVELVAPNEPLEVALLFAFNVLAA